jgi:hypothetical protein
MANLIREHRLIDSTKRALLKYTMVLDTAVANSTLVDVSTLQYALNANGSIMASDTDPRDSYSTTIMRIFGTVRANAFIKLQWHGTQNSEIIVCPTGVFDYALDTGGVIPNPEANSSGDILLTVVTPGGASGADVATLFIDLKKNNRDYDAGQTADPYAFNRG